MFKGVKTIENIFVMSITTRITFSHIYNVVKSAGQHNKPLLGRWKLSEDRDIATIVKYANEDHCGTCITCDTNNSTNNSTNNNNKINNIYNNFIKNNDKNRNRNNRNSNNASILEIDYTYMVMNNPN